MYKGKKVLALIPARGGSKGIPRKNIINVNDRPLIWYSINQAKQSKYIDFLMVSSDDQEIIDIASTYTNVPFKRPKEIALDTTPDFPVFKHAIDYFKDQSKSFDIILNLRPTSPLRSSITIDRAILQFFSSNNATSLRSMSPVQKHPYWMYHEKNGFARPFIKGKSVKEFPRRQTLPSLYYIDGLIDIMSATNFTKNDIYGDNIMIFKSPENEVLDIDTKEDLNKFITILNNNSFKNNS